MNNSYFLDGIKTGKFSTDNHFDFTAVIKELNSKVNNTDFFQKKGFSDDIISRYKLGFAINGCKEIIERYPALKSGIIDAEYYKYIIPVLDDKERCNYFIACCNEANTPKSMPKILKIPGIKVHFMNERYILRGWSNGTFIYVVNDWEDALSLEDQGFPAVALNGKEFIEDFLKLLEINKEVVSEKVFVMVGDNLNERSFNEILQKGIRNLGLGTENYKYNKKYRNLNEYYIKDKMGMKNDLGLFQVPVYVDESINKNYESGYLFDMFVDGVKNKGIKHPRSSGFKRLDDALAGGFHEGELTLIAGESGIGKTSLAIQISDNIANKDTDVMYFSLDQSKHSLTSKSLGRILYQDVIQGESSPETRLIMQNRVSEELMFRAITEHDAASRRIQIVEGNNDSSVNKIKNQIRRHIEVTGKKPVVIIDYLQIIADENHYYMDEMVDKQNLVELKRMCRDTDIVMIVISSINMNSYYTKLDFKAFDGLGGIEGIADNILLLSLYGVESIDALDKVSDRIKKYNRLKASSPRKLELNVLKQRIGLNNINLTFNFIPKYNCFEETRD